MSVRKIVIADDDDDLREMLARRCRNLGLQALTADNAYEALGLIRAARPDAACLDQNMPCGNGLSVREMLSADPHFASLPVIILTGSTDCETVRRCHDSCAYYVLKGTDTWSRVEPLLCELLKIQLAMTRS